MPVWYDASAWSKSKRAAIRQTQNTGGPNMKRWAHLARIVTSPTSRQLPRQIKCATNMELTRLLPARRSPSQWNALRKVSSPGNKQMALSLDLETRTQCSEHLKCCSTPKENLGKHWVKAQSGLRKSGAMVPKNILLP